MFSSGYGQISKIESVSVRVRNLRAEFRYFSQTGPLSENFCTLCASFWFSVARSIQANRLLAHTKRNDWKS